MDSQLISVIVPAYNIAPWLPGCLDSLLAQSHRALEVIVVDDGSSDNTRQVLEDYAARDSRVRPIFKENGGVTSARLAGAAAAVGEWIGFCDGDDTVEPDMYRRLLENAQAEGADISHCGHQVQFPDGRVEYVHNTGIFLRQDRLEGLRELLDAGRVDLSLCTKLFRRKLFDGLAERMDPSIKNNEDYLMNYFLFSKAGRSVYEDFCPYHYILRAGSASYRELNERILFDPVRVREIILADCSGELKDDARRALMRNLLFAYAQLSVKPKKEHDQWRQQVQQMLEAQRAYFPLLSKRNRLLARMVCKTPWLFRLAYGTYVKLFQREEQH